MPTPPTATDTAAVYTKQSRLERYLPPNYLYTVPEGEDLPPGKIDLTRLADIILEESRALDDELRPWGFDAPFPDIEDTDPRCPQIVQDIVTWDVIAEILVTLHHGNRNSVDAVSYAERADKERERLKARPSIIGTGRRTEPDESIFATFGVANSQVGKTPFQVWRMANRNIIADTLRFVDSAGNEVAGAGGMPFIYGLDWTMHSARQGTIILISESAIKAACGTGGGCVYEFSFRDLGWGQAHEDAIPGVSRL